MVKLFELLLPYLTIAGSVGAFCFTVFKYLHSQQQVAKDKRFEQYRNIFEWVSGRTADGKPLVDTQQAMAVYQLTEFPEYKEISLPIIEHYLEKTKAEPDVTLFRSALIFSKEKLSVGV